MTAIQGRTYPVKDRLREMGGRWDPEQKVWFVPDEKAEEARALVASAPASPSPSYSKCVVCGQPASRYRRIYRSGECADCYQERKMGY